MSTVSAQVKNSVQNCLRIFLKGTFAQMAPSPEPLATGLSKF